MPVWEPVRDSERYAAIDLLRGLALFGVLLVNLLYFFRVSLFSHVLGAHTAAGWADRAVDWLVAEFVEFKAFNLFSLTFGIGVAVQAERAASRGVPAARFLARRFTVLLLFGLCHLVFISNVDILALYAVCGLLLIPLFQLPSAVLLGAGVAAVFLPPLFSYGPLFPPEPVLREHVASASRVYGEASYSDALFFRWRETQHLILPLLVASAQKTLGLMLLGVAAWRFKVVRNAPLLRGVLSAVCLGAGILGLAFESHVALSFAYAAGLLAWPGAGKPGVWTAPVAAAGRMALSNYLMQSLICVFLFYGYGLGLFGRVATAPAAGLSLAIYAAQLAFSTWWLNRFRFGPFEWVWRSLTYGYRQPMMGPAARA